VFVESRVYELSERRTKSVVEEGGNSEITISTAFKPAAFSPLNELARREYLNFLFQKFLR
jgi:hypothetical protein